jgi:hypothetical protein
MEAMTATDACAGDSRIVGIEVDIVAERNEMAVRMFKWIGSNDESL